MSIEKVNYTLETTIFLAQVTGFGVWLVTIGFNLSLVFWTYKGGNVVIQKFATYVESPEQAEKREMAELLAEKQEHKEIVLNSKRR